MTVSKLMAELKGLPEDELQKIRAQAELLLDYSGDVSVKKKPAQARELGQVYNVIVAVLSSHDISCPPFHVLRSTALTDLNRCYKALQQLAQDSGVDIGKVTRVCARLAVRYLQDHRKPVRFRSVCLQLEGAAGLLDHAFPSYSLHALQLIGHGRRSAPVY